jgi:Concanavalin A-like lectin/glucanases superfamily
VIYGNQRTQILVTTILISGWASVAKAQSLSFIANGPNDHEYGLQTVLPDTFGENEFTMELWIKPDESYPVGTITSDTPGQLTLWAAADIEPYSSGGWWFRGNFLLDGHNNAGFENGTFSLQFYGGGRVRWLFGDGSFAGLGGHWSIGAYPASDTPSLLDGQWHQVTLVRRWSGVTDADLELWIDGVLVDVETSMFRTDMRFYWDSWLGFPGGQEGWFWGAEKGAATGALNQYEDYKGLVDEVRFWSLAMSPTDIASGFQNPVSGNEPGLVGVIHFDEGSGPQACDTMNPTQCIALINTEPSIWSTSDAPLAGGIAVPTVSQWGMIAMLLSILVVATLLFRRNRVKSTVSTTTPDGP